MDSVSIFEGKPSFGEVISRLHSYLARLAFYFQSFIVAKTLRIIVQICMIQIEELYYESYCDKIEKLHLWKRPNLGKRVLLGVGST